MGAKAMETNEPLEKSSTSKDNVCKTVILPSTRANRRKAASEKASSEAGPKPLPEPHVSELHDDALVEGIRKGDSESFNEIVQRYSQKALNLAMRITRSQEDAEEILQDVFVTVFHKIAKFEGKSAFSSWLYRITVNTAFMKLRKRKQTPAVSLEEVSPGVKESWVGPTIESADTDALSSRHELREALEKAIGRLPGEYRVIFVLRDVDGLSNQEVGEILNLSVPAVKSRLHRSRLMLRKKLQRFYDDYTDNSYISLGVSLQARMLEAA
jgi:RNA polymerase sigma-70 factor (ECF subfamily)